MLVPAKPLVPDDGVSCNATLKADAVNRAEQILTGARLAGLIAYVENLISHDVVGPAVATDSPPGATRSAAAATQGTVRATESAKDETP